MGFYHRFWPTVRILSVGDSLSAQSSSACWQLHLLAKLARLSNAELAFFFVGGSNGPPPIWHEGHAGFRIDQLLIGTYLTNNPPDIVLILAGVNDIIQDATGATAATRMTTLLTTLFTTSPTVQVVVAKIPPMATSYASYSAARAAELIDFNSRLPGVVDGFANRHVSVVDCFTGYNPDTMHSDGVHQNAIGADLIASRFLEEGYGRKIRDIKPYERL